VRLKSELSKNARVPRTSKNTGVGPKYESHSKKLKSLPSSGNSTGKSAHFKRRICFYDIFTLNTPSNRPENTGTLGFHQDNRNSATKKWLKGQKLDFRYRKNCKMTSREKIGFQANGQKRL
jgi:hypothetical protein